MHIKIRFMLLNADLLKSQNVLEYSYPPQEKSAMVETFSSKVT